MKTIIKLENWFLTQVAPEPGLSYDIEAAMRGKKMAIGKPVTAMEALMDAGEISDSIREDGEAAYCEWVAEKDWLYTCEFSKPETNGHSHLFFGGLDTDCDIYLNGEKIARHNTMYLPLRVDVSDKLTGENQLAVYFHSPAKLFRWHSEHMPEHWKGIVQPSAMIRKAPNDFYSNYLGVTPHFSPVGMFEDVTLELADRAELIETNCVIELHHDFSGARLTLSAEADGDMDGIDIAFELLNPDGTQAFISRIPVEAASNGVYCAQTTFALEKPRLWWPKGYGDQPLYTVVFKLYSAARLLDKKSRQIGIRKVELVGSLKFRVNGIVVRMWGGNVATIGNVSHRWVPQKGTFLLDKAELCNFNTLRIWGPGDLLGDSFYDEADRRGIMIWQDFPVEPSQLPDSPEYIDLFSSEAEYLVKRLRTHPSIILWCGSNESMHMLDFHTENARIGMEHLLGRVFPEICARLDYGRYYHTSCPVGGLYPNDPLFGDTHGHRCMMSYLPGEEYAVFFSEDIFTTPPELKSLMRFIHKQDIWPTGFEDKAVYGRESLLPPMLSRRTAGGLTAETKTGPLERFYDATNAESLVYKYAAAAGYGYYQNISTLRRGKPVHDSAGERRSNGHLVWKFNNTWPQFYCGLVDYYGECHIPYYSVRRAFEPFLLTFEVQDHIYVWGVNDTPADLAGTLTVKAFNLTENAVVREMCCPAAVLSGQSTVLANLDVFRHFRRDSILYASFEAGGHEIGRAVDMVDIERHLVFPQANLTVTARGDTLSISTDSFARCVELSGLSPDGDAFGWHFEDNYFDLFPFETKTVRILGKHRAGELMLKAHYSNYTASVSWRAE